MHCTVSRQYAVQYIQAEFDPDAQKMVMPSQLPSLLAKATVSCICVGLNLFE